MLYIEKNKDSILPKNYHDIHNACVVLYDQITEIFSFEEYNNLKRTTFHYDPAKQILIDELENEEIHIIDWLKENKLNDDIENFLTKHITLSVISDYCNFIYEALSCAKRGKMTVAYSLIRKPLTDELLIFEQLLQNPKGFINDFFWEGNPKKYDPSSKKLDKKKIIEKTIEKINLGSLFKADFIYQLRYDKTFKAGLNGITNQALHIVTNDRNYKTLEQNLNFVFSNKEDVERYWKHFYHLVPYLLMYSTNIIDEILFKFLEGKTSKSLKTCKSFQRIIAYKPIC